MAGIISYSTHHILHLKSLYLTMIQNFIVMSLSLRLSNLPTSDLANLKAHGFLTTSSVLERKLFRRGQA